MLIVSNLSRMSRLVAQQQQTRKFYSKETLLWVLRPLVEITCTIVWSVYPDALSMCAVERLSICESTNANAPASNNKSA